VPRAAQGAAQRATDKPVGSSNEYVTHSHFHPKRLKNL
jgi:hypothetical protein